ncbi:CatB-related O-acetyltransferase [Xanthomonas oryzae pv. oryzicola]|uniref:Acetyltransferase, CysE-LacA-LpxA-NodL family n=2 Tax=Xanthomonas oryzae pv. oryzicola TaxID=129394 RepID=G7TH16_XANOB|nr:CatB-related O-acetyltransferase [Xanthomonas oryzae]AAV67422.1 putative acetyltransferase [Xanthomonas oryzae pv. oryzicola]AEQ97957.1 acetyltransferase, CysE-LacA-LpxA-NodL family [Xanthomonas oryzae pv. oryzicola BLS256]AJQ86423.1 chloramphenicol acetyltransferase [Xanthomonas oryzae pv. oryzicola]AKK65275.1 chloramphenicol acetyltransferase [Xanthomonas oryzae pv. oryzicola]MEC5077524.1 CatB-related O-acetyltransferase [Xanthomonas oryzae pv. oryzicola]
MNDGSAQLSITERGGFIPPLVTDDPRISVGRFTYGDPQFKVWSEGERIDIGAFCSIADGVLIFGGGEHRLDWVTTYPLRIALNSPGAGQDGHPHTKGPTVIGNDVWIGHGAIVLSGVTVGDGVCVGAGAVVSKDVPPYAIVAGNPARVVRMRFDEQVIARLLEIRWWQWPIEKIRAFESLLCADDLGAFIAAASAGDDSTSFPFANQTVS